MVSEDMRTLMWPCNYQGLRVLAYSEPISTGPIAVRKGTPKELIKTLSGLNLTVKIYILSFFRGQSSRVCMYFLTPSIEELKIVRRAK